MNLETEFSTLGLLGGHIQVTAEAFHSFFSQKLTYYQQSMLPYV